MELLDDALTNTNNAFSVPNFGNFSIQNVKSEIVFVTWIFREIDFCTLFGRLQTAIMDKHLKVGNTDFMRYCTRSVHT